MTVCYQEQDGTAAGQKGCPEHIRVVIPIKLEFSASVGFIHKEFVTMHCRTILKFTLLCFLFFFYYDILIVVFICKLRIKRKHVADV